jgi:hypothetical protein
MAALSQLNKSFEKFVNSEGTQFYVQNTMKGFDNAEYDEGNVVPSGTLLTGSCFLIPVKETERKGTPAGITDEAEYRGYFPSGIEINDNAYFQINSGSYTNTKRGITKVPNETQWTYTKVFLKNLQPSDMTVGEYTDTLLKPNYQNTAGSFFFTPGKGTVWAIMEVKVAVGATIMEWGSGGYVELHRGNTVESSGSSSTLRSKIYLNSVSSYLSETEFWSAGSVQFLIDHNADTTKDVQLTIRYLYV